MVMGSPQSSHSRPDDRPTHYADRAGAQVVSRKSPDKRKASGLYLTPVEVADFMASQVDCPKSDMRILDPAAGSGTLLCAVAERLATASNTFRNAEVTAYETDPDLHEALLAVLDNLKRWASRLRIKVIATVEKKDFVLTHSHLLGMTRHLYDLATSPAPDLVIANPPYFKIPKCDPRAQAATSVVHGQPNIYALFMAAGAALLREGGEFVFIVPRSFASGPYFRLFRETFFARMRPIRIHVFGSRRAAFGRDEVLQENITLKAVRDEGWQSSGNRFKVYISSSAGLGDLESPAQRVLPLEEAFSKSSTDKILRLPTLRDGEAALKFVDSWTGTLHQYGMNISTGPVVPFRATKFLHQADVPTGSHVPLIWMNHVHAMLISFPNGTRKPQYIGRDAAAKSLLLPNRNYVLLRRFSAKEEARRLVAAPWLKNLACCSLLGIENHLNYIYRTGGELTEEETIGLAALLNTRILDTYFRTSSGNTQVSATELRATPLPPLDKITLLGSRAKAANCSGDALEQVVGDTLGIVQ
jgi:adenine-specific DNA-methyltransferase